MSSGPAHLNRQTARRFARAVRDLLTSDVRGRAIALLALLLAFALGVNGLNVVNSYVGRDFMTAIAKRDPTQFVRMAFWYIAVFAGSTAVAAFYRFTEERLGLLWRSWLTARVTVAYLRGRTYLRLKDASDVENVDQRIADDVRTFTATTLSFTLILLNATLAMVSFSGVLWAISPLLFAVAVGYAVLGSVATVWLGRPLVGLNYQQSDLEAAFRADLLHVRENAEAIALSRREDGLTARLLGRIRQLVANFRRITSVNRNVGLFTTGYNYLIQIIPTLIVAPRFIRGEIEFGVITQSAMAFAQMLGALSVIVNQFGSISFFAAVVARLGALAEAVEADRGADTKIETVEEPDRVALEGLTLRPRLDSAPVVAGLTVSFDRNKSAVVTGDEAARVALFRAAAGLRTVGEGRLARPPLDSILFLAQKPYLAPGTLRSALAPPGANATLTDEKIRSGLGEAGLLPVAERDGGLDDESDWSAKLSLAEQQALALTRVLLTRPKFVLLDRASTALGAGGLRLWIGRLREAGITCIAFEESADVAGSHDAELMLFGDGRWQWRANVRQGNEDCG